MNRMCSYPRNWPSVLAAGLLLAAMAAKPMWGQWTATNPVWTNSNVGIGTNSPAAPLEISKTGAGAFIQVSGDTAQFQGIQFKDASSPYYQWILYKPANTDNLALYSGKNNLTAMTILGANGNVGIGTTNPGSFKLAVEGTIGARDVMVTNTNPWPDYVFRPGYRLRPLSEVSQFIQANGHLPDIPTEAEVKAHGVSLGDMQAKLLAKVEELTLHMIQQEKENGELRDRMNQQTKEIQELRERLGRPGKGGAGDLGSAAAK